MMSHLEATERTRAPLRHQRCHPDMTSALSMWERRGHEMYPKFVDEHLHNVR